MGALTILKRTESSKQQSPDAFRDSGMLSSFTFVDD
jgi:hypothetical protein